MHRYHDSTPPLIEGDSLNSDEFLFRWEAMPDLARAELIDGIVSMPSPLGPQHDCCKVLLTSVRRALRILRLSARSYERGAAGGVCNGGVCGFRRAAGRFWSHRWHWIADLLRRNFIELFFGPQAVRIELQ